MTIGRLSVGGKDMRERTDNVLTVVPWSLTRCAIIAGLVGILVACGHTLIGRCCIDKNHSSQIVTMVYDATRYLWPTAGMIASFVTGPLDRDALLASVILAILANSIVYALIGSILAVASQQVSAKNSITWRIPLAGTAGPGRGPTTSGCS